MRDEILSYMDMCIREKASLQKGMNFRRVPAHSVILMSRLSSAPYEDSLSEDGTVLVYEGHDQQKTAGVNPKAVDQPRALPSGTLTENGKFEAAVNGEDLPLVRVYEKLKQGIWSDKGLFELIGSKYERKPSENRMVFKFALHISNQPDESGPLPMDDFRRIIPSWVKQAVFKRDKGQCVLCGASDELHFDHDLPFARGGTSLTPENVRILCARHNLQKGARIE